MCFSHYSGFQTNLSWLSALQHEKCICKLDVADTVGVNFTNMLRAAFLYISAFMQLQVFFLGRFELADKNVCEIDIQAVPKLGKKFASLTWK